MLWDRLSGRGRLAYSQEGEDLLLLELLNDRSTGHYVDIGAYDPFIYSNTCLFYQRGWRGLNIDATPGSMIRFNHWRSEDINVEAAVAEEAVRVDLHVMDQAQMNTLCADMAAHASRSGWASIVGTVPRQTQRLDTLLDRYWPRGWKIDFMTIDTEGMDLHVLRSNNWAVYRPDLVLAEVVATDLEAWLRSPITSLMREQGYSPHSRGFRTCVYREDKHKG